MKHKSGTYPWELRVVWFHTDQWRNGIAYFPGQKRAADREAGNTGAGWIFPDMVAQKWEHHNAFSAFAYTFFSFKKYSFQLQETNSSDKIPDSFTDLFIFIIMNIMKEN
mgnify:CR=1 FL=1